MNWVYRILVMATVAVGVVACSQSAHESAATARADRSVYAEGYGLDDYLQLLRESYNDMGLMRLPEDAAFVKYVSEDEFAAVYSLCMREQGFDAEARSDGGVFHGDVPDERVLEQLEAMYRCDVMYPPAPALAQ